MCTGKSDHHSHLNCKLHFSMAMRSYKYKKKCTWKKKKKKKTAQRFQINTVYPHTSDISTIINEAPGKSLKCSSFLMSVADSSSPWLKIVTATAAVGLALKGTTVASSPVRIVSTRFGGRAQKASNFSWKSSGSIREHLYKFLFFILIAVISIICYYY